MLQIDLRYNTELSLSARKRLEAGETVDVKTYWGLLPLRKAMLERAFANMIDLSRPVNVGNARVVILHGKQDKTVPYEESFRLQEMLRARGEVDVILSEQGDHRLSELDDLASLVGLIDLLMEEEEDFKRQGSRWRDKWKRLAETHMKKAMKSRKDDGNETDG